MHMRFVERDTDGKICFCELHPRLPRHCILCFPNHIEPVFEVSTPIDYAELWQELHATVRTKEQFEAWMQKVPKFGCGCFDWLKDYLAKTPVPDGDLAEYGWNLHSAVSRKLGKPEFTWAEFETKYGSHTDGNQDSG